MKSKSRFSLPKIGRRRNPGPAEFDALLDQFPQAAFIADAKSQKILFGNRKLAELSSYSKEELINFDLDNFFERWNRYELISIFRKNLSPISNLVQQQPVKYPNRQDQHQEQLEELPFDEEDLDEPRPDLEERESKRFTVIKKTGKSAPVRATLQVLSTEEHWAIVLLEPERIHQQKQMENLRQRQLWENLNILESSIQLTDFGVALQRALVAAKALSGAEILAIYQARDHIPGLERFTEIGPKNQLPEHLTPQDLIHLRLPQVWRHDRNPTDRSYRLARGKQFSYIATAPLGKSTAAIGLIAIADRQNPPPEYILPLIKSLATTITTIVQHHSLTMHLREQLHSQDFELAIGRTLENSVDEGILILSLDFSIVKMNAAAELTLGYATNEAIGQPIESVLIGTETLVPALFDAQKGHANYNLGNLHLFRRNGEEFLAHISTLPIVKNNKVEGVLVLLKDLSEQEQIREHTQQLQQRAILGEVTAIMAHEVRNPINNISTGLQLMAINLPHEDSNQEIIERLQQDCDRLEELMKSVLSFSKPADYDMEPVNVTFLLQRLIDRMHPRMSRVNVQHNLQIDAGCPPVRGNMRALEQVFTNLITNAVQAMSEDGGRLAVRAQTKELSNPLQNIAGQSGSTSIANEDPHALINPPNLPKRTYVEISVADTGPGIPSDLLERIFQPFFTTNRNGNGLGLAIAKRIITAHKGTMAVDSFPGGTVFRVLLPASVPEKQD